MGVSYCSLSFYNIQYLTAFQHTYTHTRRNVYNRVSPSDPAVPVRFEREFLLWQAQGVEQRESTLKMLGLSGYLCLPEVSRCAFRIAKNKLRPGKKRPRSESGAARTYFVLNDTVSVQ